MSEKASHQGQIAVGSFKFTDIFNLFLVLTEGMSVQTAPQLQLMSPPERQRGAA